MRQKVIIIGDSPLSFLLARKLDPELARLAHLEVLFITRTDRLIYWPGFTTLLGRRQEIKLVSQLNNVTLKKTQVKQINLSDRRVVTDKGSHDYDILFLDLSPVFTSDEVSRIAEQCKRLIYEMQAKVNSGHHLRSRITFAGDDVGSWQMALALASDLTAHPISIQQALSIQVNLPKGRGLANFFTSNGIRGIKTEGPLAGLTIAPPQSPVRNRLVRGALLDEGGNFILHDSLSPEGHPEFMVVDQKTRRLSNLWKVDQTLAMQIADNIESYLEGKRQRHIEIAQSSGVISAAGGKFAWLGKMEKQSWHSRAIAALDKRFYQHITL